PRSIASCCPTVRAWRSGPLPAANPTTILTGLSGYCCACDCAANVKIPVSKVARAEITRIIDRNLSLLCRQQHERLIGRVVKQRAVIGGGEMHDLAMFIECKRDDAAPYQERGVGPPFVAAALVAADHVDHGRALAIGHLAERAIEVTRN